MDNITKEIIEKSEERFKESDLQDCFITDIQINGKKVEVYIDTDDGVKFWQCQKLSRAIEAYLDESQVLGEAYTLEVSSPGIDRSLSLFRQYPRNIGRNFDLILAEDRQVTGKLVEINDRDFTFKLQGAKKGQFKTEIIPFDTIKEAIVKVSFKKKK